MIEYFPNKRMRVFARPNGSGKSIMIKAISEHRVDNRLIDLGVYVNADDSFPEFIQDGGEEACFA